MPLQKNKNKITQNQMTQLTQLAQQAETYRPGGSNPASSFTPKTQTKTSAGTGKTTGTGKKASTTTTQTTTPKKDPAIFDAGDLRAESSAIKRSKYTGTEAQASKEISRQIKSNQKEQDKIKSTINSKHGNAKSNAVKQYGSKLDELKEKRKDLEDALVQSKGITKESIAKQNESLEALRKKRADLALKSMGGNASGLGTGGYTVTPEIQKLDEQIRKAEKKVKEDEDLLYGYSGKSPAAAFASRAGKTVAGAAQSTAGAVLETAGQLTRAAAEDAQYAPGTELKANAGMGERTRGEMRGTAETLFGKADKLSEKGAASIESAKAGAGAAGKIAVDLGSEGLKLVGDMALNTVAPGAGLTSMGVRAFGSGAQEARHDGATEEQQFGYGAATAGVELLTEKMFSAALPFKKAYGGAARVGGKTLDDAMDAVINKVIKRPTVQRFAHNFAGEWLEEDMSDLLNPVAKLIYDKDAVKDTYGTAEGRKQLAEDLLYDGLIGGLLGSLGATGDVVSNIAVGNRLLNEGGGAKAANVLATAASFPEQSEAHKTAIELIERHDKGGKITAFEMGDLVHQMQESAAKGIYPDETGGSYEVTRNKKGEWQVVHHINETAQALTESGIEVKDAIKYASVLDTLSERDSLSVGQIKRKLDVFNPAVLEQVELMTGVTLPETTTKVESARAIKEAFDYYREQVAEGEQAAEEAQVALEEQAAEEEQARVDAQEAIYEESEAKANELLQQAIAEEEQARAQEAEPGSAPEEQLSAGPRLVQPMETLEAFLARKEEDAMRRYGEGLTAENRKELTEAWKKSTRDDGIRLDDGSTVGFDEFDEVMRPFLSEDEGYTVNDTKVMAAFNKMRAGSAEAPISREIWDKNLAATRGETPAEPAPATVEEESGTTDLPVEETAQVEETPAEEPTESAAPAPEETAPAEKKKTVIPTKAEAEAAKAKTTSAKKTEGVKHSLATKSANPNVKTNENVTLEQRLAAEFLVERLADKGIKGIVFDGKNLEGEKGHIDKSTGIIYLNENYLDTAMAVAQTVGHEVFHAGVEGDTQLVDSMLESARQLVEEGKLTGRNGFYAAHWLSNIDAEVERRADEYRAFLKDAGANPETIARETSPEAMREEIACDLMGMVLNNQNAIDTIAGTNPTLLDRIIETLDRLLGGRYSRMANYATSGEDTSFARYGEKYSGTVKELDKIAQRLSTALDNYRENGPQQSEDKYSVRSIFNAAGFDAQLDGDRVVVKDQNGKAVAHVTKGMVKKSGLGTLINLAAKENKTSWYAKTISKRDADKQTQAVADLLNMVLTAQDGEMVWRFAGSAIFSAVKTNSDGQYNTTIDFSTVCRKTRNMVTAMSEVMKKQKRGLTKDEVVELQGKILAQGGEVNCPVCYVFSRWAGIGGILENMYNFQNKYGHEYDPTVREDGTLDWSKLDARIAELTDASKSKPALRAMLMADKAETTYQDLARELEQNQADIKQWQANKKQYNTKALKAANADQIVELNKNIDEKKKRNAKIKDEMKEIEKLGSPELAWLKKVRRNENYWEPVKDKNGNLIGGGYVAESDILFDLDAGDKFAERYPLAWKYRTGRGPSAGKAIQPYADMRMGDLILGPGNNSANGNDTFATIGEQLTPEQEKAFRAARKRTMAQNLIGGQRFQSTSDFRYDYGLDYLQTFLEAQALGSTMQSYTKVLEFVTLAASVGGDVNISVMPLGKGYNSETGQLEFSDVTGVNIDDAIRLSQKYDSAQIILVGINDEHIRKALDDNGGDGGEYIGFVIPYHASGASINSFIASQLANITKETGSQDTFNQGDYNDYAPVQTDSVKSEVSRDDPNLEAIRQNPMNPKFKGNVNEAKRNALMQQYHRELRTAILTGKLSTKPKTQATTTEANRVLDAAREYLDSLESVDIIGRSFEELREVERRALDGDPDAIREYESWSMGLLKDLNVKMQNYGLVEEDGSIDRVYLSGQQAHAVMPHEYWNTETTRSNAYINGLIFRSYCYNLGLNPRFTGLKSDGKRARTTRPMLDANGNPVPDEKGKPVVEHYEYGDFSDEPGYWKTLIDRPMYDNSGAYRAQNAINATNVSTKSLQPVDGETFTESLALRAAHSYLDDKGVKYSLPTDTKQMDEEYMAVVESGDTSKAQEMVDAAAKRAGYNSPKLYHGTNAFGFTEVDVSKSDDGISFFATSDPKIAATYTRAKDVKRISDADSGAKVSGNYQYKDLRFDTQKDLDEFKKKYPNYMTESELEDIEDYDEYDAAEFERRQARAEYDTYESDRLSETTARDLYEHPERYTVNDLDRFISKLSNGNFGLLDFVDDLSGGDATIIRDFFEGQRDAIESGGSEEYKSFDDLLDETFMARSPAGTQYDKSDTGIYELYANLDNMLELDANNSHWNSIRFDGAGVRGTLGHSTRSIAKWAKGQGYGGVIFKNIRDNGRFGKGGVGDVYVFFDPQAQVKSADPFTYDDDGNIIPLSERFNPKQNGIRYSLHTDEDYDIYHSRALISEETLDKWLSGSYFGSSNPNYAQAYITYMSPDAFLNLTTRDRGERAAVFDRAYSSKTVKGTVEQSQRQPIQLIIDHKTGKVEGHEGRHRMVALKRAGVNKVPVLLFDSSNKYDKVPIDSLELKGQFNRFASESVQDLQPFSQSNRDTLTEKYVNQTGRERIGEKYGDRKSIRFSLRDGEESGLYIPDTVNNKTGETVSFVDLILDKLKPNETRATQKNGRKPSLPVGKWVGVSKGGKNPQVVGRVIFGEPYEITNQSPEYESTFLKDTQYELKDGETRWYYPILQVEDWRDNPQPVTRRGSRPVYNTPASAFTEKSNTKYSVRGQVPEFDALFDQYMNQTRGAAQSQRAVIPPKTPTSVATERAVGTGAASKGFVKNRTYRDAEAYAEALDNYGTMPTRPNLQTDLPVPRQTADANRVSRTAQSAINSRFVTNPMLKKLNAAVAQGKMSYFPITDKASADRAKKQITDKGWERTLADWTSEVKSGRVSKDNVTLGLMLYNACVDAGDGQRAVEILIDLSENVRSGAQAVQAMSMLDKLTPEGKLVGLQRSIQNLEQEIRNRLGNRAPDSLEIDKKLLQEYLDAKSDAERERVMGKIYQNVADQIPATWADKFNNWRYMAMLANPRTHIRNIVGNAGFAPVRGVKNVVATGLEAVFIGKKSGRTKSIVIPTKFLKSAADKARYQAAIDEWGEVENLIQSGGKFKSDWNEIRDRQTIYRGFANPDNALKKAANFLPKGVEAVRKGNSKLLDKEDVLFSRPAYASSLAQYLKANGITAEQYNAPGFDKTAARNYAIKEAQKATYRDFNAFSDLVSSIGFKNPKNKWQKGANTFVEAVLPFKRTPANILARGVEYSPIGLMNGLKQAAFDVRKGKVTAAEAIDNIASGLTGTGLLALGLLLAKAGLLSGGAPEKEKDEAMNKLTGHQNYALEIGDKSYTLDWLAPEALPVFVGVELYKTLRDGMQSGDDLFKPITRISEPILEMSMLQSLNDLIDSVGYKGDAKLWTLLASATTSYLTQYVPTLGGQIERLIETTQQRSYTDKNSPIPTDVQYALAKALNKLPGEYDQIEYVDEWGRTQDTGSFIERFFTNFISPGYYSKIHETEVDKMLKAIVEETGDRKVYPAAADKSITVNGEEHKLTGEQYTEFATKLGQTRYDLLEELRKSSDFKNMSATEKAALVTKVYEYSKATAEKSLYPEKAVDTWVTDAGKAKSEFNLSAGEYIKLVGKYGTTYLSGDDKHANAVAAYKGGVPLEKYLETKANKSKYDADDNDSYTNAETIRAYTSGSLDAKQQQTMLSMELSDTAMTNFNGARAAGISADLYAKILEDTTNEKMPANGVRGAHKSKVNDYLQSLVDQKVITPAQKAYLESLKLG